jgi:hypothetical protein
MRLTLQHRIDSASLHPIQAVLRSFQASTIHYFPHYKKIPRGRWRSLTLNQKRFWNFETRKLSQITRLCRFLFA